MAEHPEDALAKNKDPLNTIDANPVGEKKNPLVFNNKQTSRTDRRVPKPPKKGKKGVEVDEDGNPIGKKGKKEKKSYEALARKVGGKKAGDAVAAAEAARDFVEDVRGRKKTKNGDEEAGQNGVEDGKPGDGVSGDMGEEIPEKNWKEMNRLERAAFVAKKGLDVKDKVDEYRRGRENKEYGTGVKGEGGAERTRDSLGDKGEFGFPR